MLLLLFSSTTYTMAWKTLLTLALASSAAACSHHNDGEVVPEHERAELLKKWDQEWSFSGIASFAHLKPVKCLIEPEEHYDIAVIGAPFDTAVSYRPGTDVPIFQPTLYPLLFTTLQAIRQRTLQNESN
jgi:hypothetical protein